MHEQKGQGRGKENLKQEEAEAHSGKMAEGALRWHIATVFGREERQDGNKT